MHQMSPTVNSPTGLEDRLEILRCEFSTVDLDKLRRWSGCLARAFTAGGQLLTAGNSGSAAQAQHMTAELVGKFQEDRRALRAVSLSADPTTITAIANDYGYEQTFARQVTAYGNPGDVLMLFSTSGRSESLLTAARVARERGITVLGITGPAPNPLPNYAMTR